MERNFLVVAVMVMMITGILGAAVPAVPVSSPGETQNCPFQPEEGVKMEAVFWDMLDSCLDDQLETDHMVRAQTTEEYREVFSEYCYKKPVALSCIAEIAPLSKLCLSELQQKLFNIYQQNFKAALDVLCEQEGDRLSVIYGEGRQFIKQGMVQSCEVNAIQVWPETDNASLITLQKYKAVELFKQCISKLGEPWNVAVASGVLIIEEIMKQMKCLAADGTTVVSCECLDTAAK